MRSCICRTRNRLRQCRQVHSVAATKKKSAITIALLKPDHGVHVICVLQKKDVEKSEDDVSTVDITCLYPDKQILHARAVTGLNVVTKRLMTLPAHLSFSSTTHANKAVYALTVDCQ